MHGHILLRNLHFPAVAAAAATTTTATTERQQQRLIGISLIYDTCETIWKITD